jgi:hypothetical protein
MTFLVTEYGKQFTAAGFGRRSWLTALYGPWHAQGVPAPHGRGWMQ